MDGWINVQGCSQTEACRALAAPAGGAVDLNFPACSQLQQRRGGRRANKNESDVRHQLTQQRSEVTSLCIKGEVFTLQLLSSDFSLLLSANQLLVCC